MILSYNGMWPKIAKNAFLVENCDIIGDVEIGEQASVWFGVVIRGDIHYIRIGDRTNVQDLCMIHVTMDTAPTMIGSNVTIGHSAVIHGCTIEDDCLIGMGAKILDGAVIGNHSLVGAGSVVRPGFIVPPGSMVAGVPAVVKRDVTEHELREIQLSPQRYVDYFSQYIADGYQGHKIPDQCVWIR